MQVHIFAYKAERMADHGRGDAIQSSRKTYLDDLRPGQILEFGSYPVTREEVIEFATKYDPQPFHLDDAAAAANPIFKGISASGAHTMAMAQRMMVDGFREAGIQTLAGVGMDEFRLHMPVYPGDTLRMRIEILETRPSRSRPDRGSLTYLTSALNQDNEVVMTYRSVLIMARRPDTQSAV